MTEISRERTFKPRAVEEWINFVWHRPLATQAVKLFANTGVTPNQITWASGGFSIAAGIAILAAASGQWWLMSLGGVLLFCSVILDCTDGQLARLRGVSSLYGRGLDGFIDAFGIAVVFVCAIPALLTAGVPFWYFFILGVISGWSFRWQAHRYDHAKNVYLHNAPGEHKLDDPDEIRALVAQFKADGKWIQALIMRVFEAVVEDQYRHKASMVDQNGDPIVQNDDEARIYEEIFEGWMRLWSWDGIGLRIGASYVAFMLAPVSPAAILWVWWAILVPGNVLTVYLIWKEKHLLREYFERVGRPQNGPMPAAA